MTKYDWDGTGFPKKMIFTSNDTDELAYRSSKVNQSPSLSSLTTSSIKALTLEDLKPLSSCSSEWDHYSGLPATSSYKDKESEPLTYREMDALFQNHRWNKLEYADFVALIRKVESMHGIKVKDSRFA